MILLDNSVHNFGYKNYLPDLCYVRENYSQS